MAYGFAANVDVDPGLAHYLAHPTGRVALAAVALWGSCGLALVRLGLPDTLRRHELLWIAPTGACLSDMALAGLGYAGVPFHAALGIVATLGVLTAAWALWRAPPRAPAALRWWRRRRGGEEAGLHPRPPRLALAWVAYAALLIAVVALVPLLRSGFLTVIGDGSDAVEAVGTGQFLQHHYPTSVHPGSPLNQVPALWHSKTPIYYGLAAVSSLSGLETYETISTLQAVTLALACVGFFLVARELLGAGAATAVAAMLLVGLDRMALHTAMHPYFNQTWGFFAMPYALVLAGATARDGGAGLRGATVALLLAFLALGAFAYPVALPIPLLALAVMLWRARRERRARGEPVPSLDVRRLWHGARSLAWMAPLAAALVLPAVAVAAKVLSASQVVVDPTANLGTWAGDLSAYFPEHAFLSLQSSTALLVAAPFIVLGLALALRAAPPPVAWGLTAVLAFGVLAAVYMRARRFGYYFHFKDLAFVGPAMVTVAVAGLARLRAAGWVMIALWISSASAGALVEVQDTFNQLPLQVLALRTLDATVPHTASIRLDVNPSAQLWPAFLLSRHPLCSEHPLLNTSYPHVPVSSRADYILVNHDMLAPVDAVPGSGRKVGQYVLYRERPGVPDLGLCSRRTIQQAGTASS